MEREYMLSLEQHWDNLKIQIELVIFGKIYRPIIKSWTTASQL